MRLLDYASNVNSQNGEDGILAKMLEVIPSTDKWCVEFGAWDGRYLSNVCHLIEASNYSAVLIEPDKKKFKGLLENFSSNPRIIAINSFVGITPEDNLGHMLAKLPIPRDFDLLTIDIEGNDYHAWDALSGYTPKIVHVALNPTIPTEVDFVQPVDPSVSQGSSLLALTKLGKRKGYELVCTVHNSAFFVQARYFPLFGISNNDPRALREDFTGITYLFCGLDGTIFVTGRDRLPHHRGIRIHKRLRQLPRIFRSYPQNFSPLREWLYKFYWRLAQFAGRG